MRFAITNTSNSELPTTYKIFDLVTCSFSDFYKRNLNNIRSAIIGGEESSFCLPDEFKENVVGQFGNPYFKLPQIIVGFCNNATTNNTCLTRSEIEQDLASFFVNYVFLDNYFDFANNIEPIKQYWRSEMLQLSSKTYMLNQYQMKIANLKTDDGLIMESFKFINSFQFDTKTSLISTHPDYLLIIQTFISNINVFTVRKYLKLQTVIANTGGITKIFTMILTFICKYLNNFHFIQTLYTKAFNKYSFYYETYNNEELYKLNKVSFFKNPIK